MFADDAVVYGCRVYGYAIVALTLTVIVVSGWFALRAGAAFVSVAPIALLVLLVTLAFSTIDIRVTRRSVSWWLTFGLFKRTLPFSEIASIEPARVIPLGWGYRIGYKSRAWIVAGGKVVRIKTVSGETLVFNAPNPAELCRTVESLRAAAPSA